VNLAKFDAFVLLAPGKEVFLTAVIHGSSISWQRVNMFGEYEFSEKKLQDGVGIRPP
jgi:hypothetical protein